MQPSGDEYLLTLQFITRDNLWHLRMPQIFFAFASLSVRYPLESLQMSKLLLQVFFLWINFQMDHAYT